MPTDPNVSRNKTLESIAAYLKSIDNSLKTIARNTAPIRIKSTAYLEGSEQSNVNRSTGNASPNSTGV